MEEVGRRRNISFNGRAPGFVEHGLQEGRPQAQTPELLTGPCSRPGQRCRRLRPDQLGRGEGRGRFGMYLEVPWTGLDSSWITDCTQGLRK